MYTGMGEPVKWIDLQFSFPQQGIKANQDLKTKTYAGSACHLFQRMMTLRKSKVAPKVPLQTNEALRPGVYWPHQPF